MYYNRHRLLLLINYYVFKNNNRLSRKITWSLMSCFFFFPLHCGVCSSAVFVFVNLSPLLVDWPAENCIFEIGALPHPYPPFYLFFYLSRSLLPALLRWVVRLVSFACFCGFYGD